VPSSLSFWLAAWSPGFLTISTALSRLSPLYHTSVQRRRSFRLLPLSAQVWELAGGAEEERTESHWERSEGEGEGKKPVPPQLQGAAAARPGLEGQGEQRQPHGREQQGEQTNVMTKTAA